MSKNIIVAGLGHGGIAVAAILSKNGYNVTVYEKNSEGTLGYDWTDMFDPKALEFAEIPMPPADKFKYKENMTFCGPCSKKVLTQYIPKHKTEIIMERKEIYNHFIDNAVKCGVNIVYDCEVLGPVLIGDRVVGIKTSKGEFLGDLVIDSCGMNSPVRRNLPKQFGIQREIKKEQKISIYRAFYNKCSDDAIDGKFKIILYACGKPGVSWVASHDDYTDVLIGRFEEFGMDEVERATDFLRRTNSRLGTEKIRGGQFVDIPVRHTLSVMVANGYAAIGDSAFMTVPLIGSGIANALRASRILADTIIADKSEFYSAETLWRYQVEYYYRIGSGLSPLECVKSALLKLRTQDVDYCFESEIITQDDMTIASNFTNIKDLFEIRKMDIIQKIKGIKNNKRLVIVAFGAVAKMSKVLVVSAQIPKKWDKTKVLKWAKQYDKMFE
ncbi:MAG: hypothetical protein J6A49_09025 [Clostridia bacterium]|nr:hypothetical protein [Clostridia bacterium]